MWTTDGHVSCSVPWAHVAAIAAVAVTCAAAGFQVPVAGRILLWAAAACMAAVAARDALVRPTLTTNDEGITLVRTWRPETIAWADIDSIGRFEHRRLGSVRALEIDAGDTLLLVPARRLGAELADVVDALRQERLSHRG